MFHKPVLLKEVIDNLNLKPGMTVVDGTLGSGGHSKAVLEKILPGGRLISIDWDERAVQNFEKKLLEGLYIAKRKLIRIGHLAPVNSNKKIDGWFSLELKLAKLGNRGSKTIGNWCGVVDNYANLKEILRGLGVKTADAIFADLGFSSDQIEDAQRGFSFLRNGPLDMRYSPETEEITAADIINKYSKKELIRIFRDYGEEKFAKRIAEEIEKKRKVGEIKETGELVEIISKIVPENYRRGRIHFATKVFQALRIETNRELENLENFLKQAVEILASEGRLAIISFHSLEDRIVKNFFRKEAQGCTCPPKFPKCVCGYRSRLVIITKKPITASKKEIQINPRARSAKLRVAQKI